MSTATMTTNRLNGPPAAKKTGCVIPSFAQGWDIKHLPNGWGVAVVDVSPDLAEQILATNVTNQRKVRKAHISSIARDMQSGRWKSTHQGICLNRMGCLHDGQHRLLAVIESGVTIQMVVFIGAGDKQEMMVFDGMAARSVNNASQVIGVHCDNSISSTVNALYYFAIAQKSQGGSNRLTKTEQVELISKYNAEAALVHSWFVNSPCSGTNRAPIKSAVVAALLHGIDPGVLERFSKIVCDKLPATEPTDSAARLLRLFAAKIEGGGGSVAKDLFLRTSNAIVFTNESKEMKRLTPSTECPFPVEA